MSDTQPLLAEYVQKGSDTAFRELVDRYINLVYSTALRLVNGDAHRAQDITQMVFLDLARNAGKLSSGVMLGGWLHRHTCFVALNVIRQERRRQTREQEAAEMNALNDTADFSSLAPILDEAINELEEPDRTAILLRFFEQHDFRSVGKAIGANEDAARMRVNRALEKLQTVLKKRGLTATAASLGVLLTANAIQAAPLGLAGTIALAAATIATSAKTAAAISATKTIAMTTMHKTIIGTVVATLIGVSVFQAQRNATLREDIRSLQANMPQVQELQRGRDDDAKELEALRAENTRLKGDSNELQRLRAEVRQLRAESKELSRLKTAAASDETVSEALQWKQRVAALKQRVEQSPEVRIPELQLLGERDWLDAVVEHELKSDKDFREALSRLRNSAEQKLAPRLQLGLSTYLSKNNEQFPTSLAQLAPYLNPPLDDAILQRWTVLPAKQLTSIHLGGDWIITQSSAPDPEMDNRFGVGPNGYGSTGSFADSTRPNVLDLIGPLLKSYASANSGQTPEDPSQLAAYATTSDQREALANIIRRFSNASESDKAQMREEVLGYLKQNTDQ